MANEWTVRSSMNLRNGNYIYTNQTTYFLADQDALGGPTPGEITASVFGTDVDLSHLTSPGLCWVENKDETNFITVGVWNSVTSEFYPLMDILPGEGYPLRLSRYLGEEIVGTGTLASQATTLRVKADTDECKVLIEAFES